MQSIIEDDEEYIWTLSISGSSLDGR